MEIGEETAEHDSSEVVDHWVARTVRPVVVLYVIAVFVGFIAMAHFIFQSADAVKALVMAAVGAVVATVPAVLGRMEYRLTGSGIERRTVNRRKPSEFKDVFSWEELSRVVAMRHGFKYYKTLSEPGRLRRFWKLHISDKFSGEVHVERRDLERVLAIIARKGIEIS